MFKWDFGAPVRIYFGQAIRNMDGLDSFRAPFQVSDISRDKYGRIVLE